MNELIIVGLAIAGIGLGKEMNKKSKRLTVEPEVPKIVTSEQNLTRDSVSDSVNNIQSTEPRNESKNSTNTSSIDSDSDTV